ncbi:MAG: cyclic nucleotide-binding domain-containing protein [Deltaproteobacteria bacterium]|nr:cyclic nucleotide-binding domain-containing protein [Deltaproteobacteria bacterium]MBW1962447.1 cyclic nucleotide-binding domain-containing protein [Deltaproteobacteria bacterium]MBW2154213.1 cyclic nucleotide-binding domain-containing protein [Deltaproteobacteria bacterium]
MRNEIEEFRLVKKEDLKRIVIFSSLSDDMLDKVAPIIDFLRFDEREAVFREGQIAERFYMVRRGKVLLEKRISGKVAVSLGTVKAGFSFGWSALLDGGPYTSDAICAEPCEIFSARREKILPLMDADKAMGYIISQSLLRIIKKRLDLRTEQLLRAIQNHPDLQSLLSASVDI